MYASSTPPDKSLTAASCPVCGTFIHERPFICPHCDTPHHQDCWDYNGGCATYGCPGVPGGLRRGRVALTVSGNLPASTGARMVAFMIDWFLLWVAAGGIGLAAQSLLGGILSSTMLFALPLFALSALWLLRDVAAGGRSPGKAILGIEVEQPDETSTGFRNSVLRNAPLAGIYLSRALGKFTLLGGVAEILMALCAVVWVIEVILVMGSRDGRRLGDRLAGTTIINQPRKIESASEDDIQFLGPAHDAGDDGIQIVSTTSARDRFGLPPGQEDEEP